MRLISRLDVKNSNLIKTINLEGLRSLGNATDYALKYYREGIDEIFISDPVASLYNREPLYDVLENLTKNIFIPITIGGGIKCISDVVSLLRNGADKVALNTAVIENPELISDIANVTGSQSVVVSIQARRVEHKWLCYTNCGRDNSGKDLVDWIIEAELRGAGEFIITSVDKEGTFSGVDRNLIQTALNTASVPITYSGGFGSLVEFQELPKIPSLSGLCIAGALHYGKVSICDLRNSMVKNGFDVRLL